MAVRRRRPPAPFAISDVPEVVGEWRSFVPAELAADPRDLARGLWSMARFVADARTSAAGDEVDIASALPDPRTIADPVVALDAVDGWLVEAGASAREWAWSIVLRNRLAAGR